MAGSSLSPGRLRSKETSPNLSPLLLTPSPLLLTPKKLSPRLPPIAVETSSSASTRAPPSTPEPWSWYHRNCQQGPRLQTSLRRRQKYTKTISRACKFREDLYENLRHLHMDHHDVLVAYVAEEVSIEELEDCLRRKRRGTSHTSLESSSWLDGASFNSGVKSASSRINESSSSGSSTSYSKSLELTAARYSKNVRQCQSVYKNNNGDTEDVNFKLCTGYKPRKLQPGLSDDEEEVPDELVRHTNTAANVVIIHPNSGDELEKEPSVVPISSKLEVLLQPKGKTSKLQKKEEMAINGTEDLDDDKKMITNLIEEIITKLFPTVSVEMYLLDLRHDLHCITRDSLEHTSNQHQRIIRKVVAERKSCCLNRQHIISCFSSLPRYMVEYFHKNYHVAFVPLQVEFGNVVVEIWQKSAFNAPETALIHSLQKIVSITLPYHRQYQTLLKESQISAFLLQVAQAVFEEMISLDQLIKKILEVAQRLVSADRASLFLVDHTNSELVSTVFDLRYEASQDSEFLKKEIRMPINKGIAGHVAMSGETMNIPDAYMDERFNKAVDEATGYHTVSILCMPIKVRGRVLAVVQMVNKRNKKVFGPDDESAFQVFSTFFGLALHHAKLYDKIKRKEDKYKVALEVLGYHNTCCEEDVATILEEKSKEAIMNYNDFALNPFEVNNIEKCKGILRMFEDLFDMTRFDLKVLTRFVLTVKKNYRRVPYHNFDHGWAVANSMYVMLKNDTEARFDFNSRLALFVACLCHDLDHRGYTNKFMTEIESPLAAIYTTSTLEHHHFNMTVTILQQDGHNIFYQMSSDEYKDVLDSIRECILATDLAAFFPNLKKIKELVFETPQFDWNDASHRALTKSFLMTGADLSASAKPFDTQLKTVEIIFAEFYEQGDLERQAGRSPIPMMDRRCQDQLPECQVGFLTSICKPCYQILVELFPRTKPMLDMVDANIMEWKERAERAKKDNDI